MKQFIYRPGKRWLFVVFTSVLGACVAPQPAAVRTYDLGVPRAAAQSTIQLDAPITIPPVSAPSWLQGSALVYRLAYAVPPYPQVYSLSRWIAAPGDLITLRLRDAVAAANTNFTLTSTAANPTGYVLEVTLEEFTHEFESPTSSRCIVQLRATLLDRSAGLIVAQKTLRAEQQAPSPDAAGGVRGLIAATDTVIDGLLVWLESHPGTDRATGVPARPFNAPTLSDGTRRTGIN